MYKNQQILLDESDYIGKSKKMFQSRIFYKLYLFFK